MNPPFARAFCRPPPRIVRRQARGADDILEPSADAIEGDHLGRGDTGARLVSWSWDAGRNRIERPHGVHSGDESGIPAGAAIAAFLRRIQPPFRRRVEDGLRAAAAGGDPCVLRYPLVGRGPTRWVETRASRAPTGSPAAVLWATTQEISEPWGAREPPDDGRGFWRSVLASLPVHVAIVAADGEIVAVNEAWADFDTARGGNALGVGTNFLAVCDAQVASGCPYAARAADGMRAVARGQECPPILEFAVTLGAEQRWFAQRCSPFRGPGPARIVIQRDDITEAKLATAAILTQARLLDAVDASVIATTLDAQVTHWNRGAERLYGWTADEAVGRPITELTIGERSVGVLDEVRQQAADAGRAEAEIEVRDKDGRRFPVDVRTALLFDEAGDRSGLVSISVDIRQRMEGERRLRAAESYLRAVTDSMGEGLVTLDGDGRLTYINRAAANMLGWPASGAQPAVPRPSTDARPFPPTRDIVAHAPEAPGVVRVDDGVFTRRDGTALPVSHTSSRFTSSEGDEGWAVVFSDITARKAEQDEIRRQLETFAWVDRIRHALAEDGFCLAAQPILDIASGRVVHHELLVRMRGDDGRMIPPGRFLPAAEQTGVIRDIDRWVLGQATALAGAGHAVHVNVSATSLGDADLFRFVEESLAHASADPSLIVFEVTETAVLENEQRAKAFMDHVAALGCRVALDDFGTGYGGFTYLKRLPVHFLKIDREFVRDLAADSGSQHVVRAIVALARGFGLQTVAEGIENRAVMAVLRRMGVDYGQGYALGRPRPVETVFPATASEDAA